jgi:transcriptional regulator with XRE-family HTH domain
MLNSHPSFGDLERPSTGRAASELDEALGNAIRLRRRNVGLTQEDLAVQCGVSFQQIQKYENGANRISFSRLAQIAKILETSVADLANALIPADGASIGLTELKALAIPGAPEMLAEFAKLTPEARRILVAFLRQLREGA